MARINSPLKIGWCLRIKKAKESINKLAKMFNENRSCRVFTKSVPVTALVAKKASIKVVIPKSAKAEKIK